METRLADLNTQLDDLSTSISKSTAKVKAEALPRLASLKVKRDLLAERLKELKNADGSTWELVKASTAHAYEDVKTGFSDLRQWLSVTIAP
jgi:hypothetical protein